LIFDIDISKQHYNKHAKQNFNGSIEREHHVANVLSNDPGRKTYLIGGKTDNIFSINISQKFVQSAVEYKQLYMPRAPSGPKPKSMKIHKANSVHIMTSDHDSFTITIDFAPIVKNFALANLTVELKLKRSSSGKIVFKFVETDLDVTLLKISLLNCGTLECFNSFEIIYDDQKLKLEERHGDEIALVPFNAQLTDKTWHFNDNDTTIFLYTTMLENGDKIDLHREICDKVSYVVENKRQLMVICSYDKFPLVSRHSLYLVERFLPTS